MDDRTLVIAETEEIRDIEEVLLEGRNGGVAPGSGSGAEGGRTVVLRMEQGDRDDDAIDLVNVAGAMRRRWKAYAYLLAASLCASSALAALSLFAQGLLGGESRATALVSFGFDGIDRGLAPDGSAFDAGGMKSTEVVGATLEALGVEDVGVEEIRALVEIEGVMPDSVKQRVAVINRVSEDAAEYYAKLEDIDYFPSQYTVSLRRPRGMSGKETEELLDAVLSAYGKAFMERYASAEMLGSAFSVLDVGGYDYLQASEMIKTELSVMRSYAESRAREAPSFRAFSTGLTFGDLAEALGAVETLDLGGFVSFVRSNNLTKDAGVQIDYYNYRAGQCELELQKLREQLSTVEVAIEGYEKNPLIVVGNQESVIETAQTDEYYKELIERKLNLTGEIGELSKNLSEAREMAMALSDGASGNGVAEDYAYADALQEGLVSTVEKWGELARQTAEEYVEAELYAGACRVSVPAQYSTVGGIGDLAKRMALFGGVSTLAVAFLWALAGLREEVLRGRGLKD